MQNYFVLKSRKELYIILVVIFVRTWFYILVLHLMIRHGIATLGIVPVVFVHEVFRNIIIHPNSLGIIFEVFGKDFAHLFISILVQSSTKTSGEVGRNLTKYFMHELFGNVARSPQEWIPWSLGRVFPPVDDGDHSCGIRSWSTWLQPKLATLILTVCSQNWSFQLILKIEWSLWIAWILSIITGQHEKYHLR